MAIPRNLANIAPHVNASSTELVVNDGGANLDFRVEGDTNANLLVADAGAEKVGFGTNTFNTNGGVLQVSNGISFPATQSACSDANTLDDYEEGTWTPSIGNSYSAPTTVTYTAQNGSYTKIGRLVVAAFHIEIASFSGGGGPVFFGGLPFNPATTTDARFQGTAYLSGPDTPASTVTVNLGYAKLDNGSYYLVFNCPRDDTAMVNAGTLQVGDLAANDVVAGTFTYFV